MSWAGFHVSSEIKSFLCLLQILLCQIKVCGSLKQNHVFALEAKSSLPGAAASSLHIREESFKIG